MELHRPHKRLARSIPRSKMVYPQSAKFRAQYLFWRVITPVHPLLQEIARPVRGMRGKLKRQTHLLGVLTAERDFGEFLDHLTKLGYRRHDVAWRDPDQILSVRLVENFEWQYHLRVYNDGEVRGHYELTPESYPFKHLVSAHKEERREVFMEHLDGWLV